MTLTEMAAQVTARMNLSSTTATTRVKASIKERYAHVLGAIGMLSAKRGTVSANATVGNREIALSNVQKVLAVRNASGVPLGEISYQQMRNTPLESADAPTQYAISATTHTSVTILLNSTPATTFAISADVVNGADPASLGDTDEPTFTRLYHSVLVYGALATEAAKMEKTSLVEYFEKKFDGELLALQRFMAGDLQ